MTEYVCFCGAAFKNITDLREHENECSIIQQDERMRRFVECQK